MLRKTARREGGTLSSQRKSFHGDLSHVTAYAKFSLAWVGGIAGKIRSEPVIWRLQARCVVECGRRFDTTRRNEFQTVGASNDSRSAHATPAYDMSRYVHEGEVRVQKVDRIRPMLRRFTVFTSSCPAHNVSRVVPTAARYA